MPNLGRVPESRADADAANLLGLFLSDLYALCVFTASIQMSIRSKKFGLRRVFSPRAQYLPIGAALAWFSELARHSEP